MEDIIPGGFKVYKRFQQQQALWLGGKAERPHMKAISALDSADWAQGRVLDLRKLSEGVVTELDYTAPIRSKFNLKAVLEAFQDYSDQEVISFWVLGVSFKAELPHQMVFNRHLLNLEGYHEQVYNDKAGLAEEPLCWVGLFQESPFFPARFNGNGQVPKGAGIRPTDEGGGARTPSVDSKNVRVLSLNQYMDGEDMWILVPEHLQSDLKAEAKRKWVKERKPKVKHVRLANSIIKEGADLCSLPVYVFRLDWFKMFNQFALRPEEYWKSCHCFPQGFIVNYCLTFGLSMASNVAQRAANAFVWLFMKEFGLLDAPFLQQLRDEHSEFEAWCESRGEGEALLLWMCCYTDDPLWVVAGADRVVRAVKLYHALAEKLGFLPSSFDKFAIGISTVWIGIESHVFFGLTEVTEVKAAKAVMKLSQALQGGQDSQDAVKMLGLLEHCRDALGVKGHSLFPLWQAVDRSEAAAVFVLEGKAREFAQEWITFMASVRGSSVATLLNHLPPRSCSLAMAIFSDAALEPPEEAGIGGFILGYYWRVAVEEGLQGITIPVLELLAAGVNLVVLHHLMGCPRDDPPPCWVRWEIDALSGHFALCNESAKSEMMRAVHELIKQSEAFQYFKPALVVCHVYGPGNPGDAPSRGKIRELRVLASALRFNLKPLSLPA